MHFMDRGLVHGLNEKLVDVDMSRPVCDPNQDLRDILRGERFNPLIDFLRPLGIAFEADERELGFSHAGVDGGDPDAGAVQFQAQGAGDLEFAGFGGAVGGSAFVGGAAGERPDVDDGSACASAHEG